MSLLEILESLDQKEPQECHEMRTLVARTSHLNFFSSVFEFWACQWRYSGGGNGQSIGLAKWGFNPLEYIDPLPTGEPTPLRSVHPRLGWNGLFIFFIS